MIMNLPESAQNDIEEARKEVDNSEKLLSSFKIDEAEWTRAQQSADKLAKQLDKYSKRTKDSLLMDKVCHFDPRTLQVIKANGAETNDRTFFGRLCIFNYSLAGSVIL